MFDFIEAMCIAMLISMRTSLLRSDENEMLVLLMRFTLGSVTEMRTKGTQESSGGVGSGVERGGSTSECGGGGTELNEVDIVQGLISMALELMEHPSWPNLQTVDLNGLMETVWGSKLDLTKSSAELRKQQSEISVEELEEKKEQLDKQNDRLSNLSLEHEKLSNLMLMVHSSSSSGGGGGAGGDGGGGGGEDNGGGGSDHELKDLTFNLK